MELFKGLFSKKPDILTDAINSINNDIVRKRAESFLKYNVPETTGMLIVYYVRNDDEPHCVHAGLGTHEAIFILDRSHFLIQQNGLPIIDD